MFLAIIVGRYVAAQRFDNLLGLFILLIFFLLFFSEKSVYYILPLLFVMPNRGMDIPGPFAVLMWDFFTVGFFGGLMVRRFLAKKKLLTMDSWTQRLLFLFIILAAESVFLGGLNNPSIFMFGFKEIIRLLELSLVIIGMTAILDTEEKIIFLVRNLVIASAFSLTLALLGHFVITDIFYPVIELQEQYVLLGTYRMRMASTAGNVAQTGIYFLMSMGLAAFWFKRQGIFKSGILALVLVVALSFGILLTFNKGTWMAAFTGVAIMLYYSKIRFQRLLLILAFVALLGVVIFYQIQTEGQFSVIATDLSTVVKRSGTVRIQRWLALGNVLTSHPLLGMGYNCFAFLYGEYAVEEVASNLYGHPHNMYVDIMAGTGLLGFTAFILLGIRLFMLSLRNMKNAATSSLRSLSFFIHLNLWFFFAGNMTASFLFKPVHPANLMAVFAGIILAIQNISIKSRSEQPKEKVQEATSEPPVNSDTPET